MSKILSILMAISLMGFVHSDTASAKVKPKKSKAQIEFEAFWKKLTAPKKQSSYRRPAKKKKAVEPVFPMPMPLSIAAQRAGMTVEEYQKLHPETVTQTVTEVVPETVVVEPETQVVPPTPVAVEEPKNPYLDQDCKQNETDPLMCMTCIIYFEAKVKGDAKALEVARNVKEDIAATGSDACYELFGEKPNRFGDAWIANFVWITKDAKVDTKMTRNEALNKAYLSAGEIMGLTPVHPDVTPPMVTEAAAQAAN